jgi:hypothetical protein
MSFALSVIPAKAGAEDDRRSIHERGRTRPQKGGVHGSRVKPGMTRLVDPFHLAKG